MASDETSQGDGQTRQPISPAKRKRLQQCFEHGNRQMGQENFDYASELFSQCIVGDPGNFLYLQSFLGNLKKKYGNNKKGSNLAFIQGASARRAVKKAKGKKKWPDVIKSGLEALKLNPWDVPTLTTMAEACEELGCEEVPLAYLKMALEANPNDPDVAKLCALALRERKQYDQAIAMWHRVQQAKPDDEEAQRAIASLAVEKTIAQGGYDDKTGGKGGPALGGKVELYEAPQKRLEREIARHPDDIPRHIELADLYLREDLFDKAEEILTKAFEISGQSDDVRERLEDVRIRNFRQKIAEIERELEQNPSEELAAEQQQLKKQLFQTELEVYQHRCEKNPNNLAFKYELGVRYQLNTMYNEAIQQFQLARNDPRRKGVCLMRLGQCFQHIKQFRLAMSHFQEAIQEIPDRDADNKKLALYQAGKLATALKDYDEAEKYLTTLAGLDFAYRDVSALLDKLGTLRDGESGGEEE